MPERENPTGPSEDRNPSREELCRRIDEEIERMGDIAVSSWRMALRPAPLEAGPDDGRPLASEVEQDAALGALLWRAGTLEHTSCFHATRPDGTLMAVLKPKTGALFARPVVALADLENLALQRRPLSAGGPLPGYRPSSIAAALWRFALFWPDGENALPRHFRALPLRLRRPPPLDPELVAIRHLKLMKLLGERDRTFVELGEKTTLSDHQLCRDLAALMLVGSVGIA